MGRTQQRRAVTAVVATVVAGATVAFAGGAGAAGVPAGARATTTSNAANGKIIKYAEDEAAPPNYIFPETSTANQSLYNNDQFINLLYPLLYLPSPNQPTLDYKNSMAYPPVWSDNDTVVTVKLKHYMWSDGTPVTAQDSIMYINLGKAMGTTWGNFDGTDQFPYNLKSYKAVNSYELRFVLKKPISPIFFDDNGLDYIAPLPAQAWDKTSTNGPVGNYDMTPSGAKKVLAFLQKEAADTNTYATNPLWQVVDGAWKLKSYGGSSSPDVFVPNPSFSGTKPKVSEFEEIPFTSDAAEFTSIKAGASNLDYGYVPSEDIPALSSLKSEGYNISKVAEWGFDYIIPNTKNPTVGPVLSQTYIRQVLAHLTDQETMIQHFMEGYGIPTYGPTPVYPKGNEFVSKAELHNPYPYSVSAAEKVLKKHGWLVNTGGTDTCTKPGPSGCGAGVTKGEKLSLNLLYANGDTVLQEDTDLFQSDAAKAGITINPKSAAFDTVISQVQACHLPKEKNAPTCTWQLGEYGGISEATYPSGEGLLNTGGAFNAGQYSNKAVDKYIAESSVAKTLVPYKDYEDTIVQQEPWIWQPVPDHLAATVKSLSGYGLTSEFDGYRGYIEPQFWALK